MISINAPAASFKQQKQQMLRFSCNGRWITIQKVRASESLNNYWRVLNMHIFDEIGRTLGDDIQRDVNNVSDGFATILLLWI